MLDFVTWKWKPRRGPPRDFCAEHVNVLARMVNRHYPDPHRFTCITDDPEGVDASIRVIPLWDDNLDLSPPARPGGLSCYVRLKIFSAEMADLIGQRIVSLDLDTLITDDLRPVFNRPEDFVIWGDTNPSTPYNGGLFMLTAGARRQVWEDFDPATSPLIGHERNYFGSDQAWIGACLGPDEVKWSTVDGVYSFRNHILPRRGMLPTDARVVSFHGNHNPWSKMLPAEMPWIAEHWR